MLKTVGSIKVAGALFAIITVACILSTLIPQNAQPSWSMDKYGSLGVRVVTHLHLTDVFHSWWFTGALALFGVNLLACTISRKPWKLRQLGFLFPHAGVIVLLAGALVGMMGVEKGHLRLNRGETRATYASQGTGNKEALRFRVHPDDFQIERYPEPTSAVAKLHGYKTELVELDKGG